jgi:hypothetical protein
MLCMTSPTPHKTMKIHTTNRLGKLKNDFLIKYTRHKITLESHLKFDISYLLFSKKAPYEQHQ